MLTIPLQAAGPSEAHAVTTAESVLVIGRSEKVLVETVDLLRADGRVADATNDFEHVLALFDATQLMIVVFGGMVPPDTKEALRAALTTANPRIAFVQGLAGIPGLIADQVRAAVTPTSRYASSIDYNRERRVVAVTLETEESIRITAYWGTAFVPPDPESTSEIIIQNTFGPGTHRLPLPESIPTAASFIVVTAGDELYPFVVGPMPPRTTLAVPPA